MKLRLNRLDHYPHAKKYYDKWMAISHYQSWDNWAFIFNRKHWRRMKEHGDKIAAHFRWIVKRAIQSETYSIEFLRRRKGEFIVWREDEDTNT